MQKRPVSKFHDHPVLFKTNCTKQTTPLYGSEFEQFAHCPVRITPCPMEDIFYFLTPYIIPVTWVNKE